MPNRTPEEQRLLEKAAQYMPGGYTGNLRVREDLNFLIKEGKGSRVWDVSGNEYVDWMMGSGPMVLGHAHPAVVEAVIKAVEQGSTFFATNERAVLLAEQLVEAVPCAEKIRFTTSGTDATFQAMRSARAFRKREKVLKFEGGFHGTSDYALMSVTPSAAQDSLSPNPTAGDSQGHRRTDVDCTLQRSGHNVGHHRRPPRRVGGCNRGAVATDDLTPAGLPSGTAGHHRQA